MTSHREEALKLIGQCAAGGKRTGEALRLFQAGEFGKAFLVAKRQIEEQSVATFAITLDVRTMEFAVTTTDEVASFNGTPFVPTLCSVRIVNGKIVSIGLDKLDENGWGIDDPAGEDGAELNVSYGGAEIVSPGRAKLPQVARAALAAIEKEIGR
jgi:hypothetical protein